MYKRTLIFFMMILSYAFVLGHSIVPHHHHDEIADIQNSHHDDDRDDHNQHEAQSPLSHFFSHFVHDSHTKTTETHISSQDQNEDIVKKQNLQCLIVLYNTFIWESTPVINRPPEYKESNFSQEYLRGLSLRAPPIC